MTMAAGAQDTAADVVVQDQETGCTGAGDDRRELGDLCPVLSVGRGAMEGKHLAERVDREADLAAVAPLGPVSTRPIATFRRTLQGSAIQDDRSGLGATALAKADQLTQVGKDRGEDLGLNPAPGLLGDRLPRRQIMGQIAPLEPSPGDEAEAIEELPHGVAPLGASSRMRVR